MHFLLSLKPCTEISGKMGVSAISQIVHGTTAQFVDTRLSLKMLYPRDLDEEEKHE